MSLLHANWDKEISNPPIFRTPVVIFSFFGIANRNRVAREGAPF